MPCGRRINVRSGARDRRSAQLRSTRCNTQLLPENDHVVQHGPARRTVRAGDLDSSSSLGENEREIRQSRLQAADENLRHIKVRRGNRSEGNARHSAPGKARHPTRGVFDQTATAQQYSASPPTTSMQSSVERKEASSAAQSRVKPPVNVPLKRTRRVSPARAFADRYRESKRGV